MTYQKNPVILQDFVQQMTESSESINGVAMITPEGIIEQYRWKESRKQNFHSISKTLVTIAVGFACEDGFLSPIDQLKDLFKPRFVQKEEPSLAEVTLHHLLSMSIGQEEKLLMMGARDKLADQDWVDYCLSYKLTYEPGAHFCYTNAGPYLAAVALQQKTGENLASYLGRHLFKPLGIEDYGFETDPQGFSFGAGGLFLTPDDFAKIAQFILNRGKWQQTQLLSEKWFDQMTKPYISVGDVDLHASHYGYGLWINEEQGYYRADGAFGQIILVLPNLEIAIAIDSDHANNHFIMGKIMETILSLF